MHLLVFALGCLIELRPGFVDGRGLDLELARLHAHIAVRHLLGMHLDAEKLWRNWTAGIHRVACYGDLSKDLERFCRFADLALVNEAV